MPSVRKIEVKEGLAELKKSHKVAAPRQKPGVQMLNLALQNNLLSKQHLARALGVNAGSVQDWKKPYKQDELTESCCVMEGVVKSPL